MDTPPEDEMKDVVEVYPQYIISLDDYVKIKTIGKGGYAEVWLVSYKGTEKQMALKQLFSDISSKQVHHFAREIATMAKANHPYFVKFMGFSPYRPMSLLTEYMPNGSLYRFIRQDPKGKILNGTRRTIIAMGIASAMATLHSMSIIHRDLKSMNILLDSEFYPRICDFGIARFNQNDEKLTMRLGTPHWMAPESLYGEGYGFPVDVYSFAMVLYELLTFKLPWAGMDALAVTRAVVIEKKRPILPKCPAPLKNLICRCWDQDPNQRPTFAEIYRLFATGKVYFESTNKSEILAMHENLVLQGVETPFSNGPKFKNDNKITKSPIKHHGDISKNDKSPSSDDSKDFQIEIGKEEFLSDNRLEKHNIPSFSESDTLPKQPDKRRKSNSKMEDIPEDETPNENENDNFDGLSNLRYKRQTSAAYKLQVNEDSFQIPIEILSDLKHPEFRKTFSECVANIAPNNVRSFFSTIAPHFNKNTSDSDFEFILTSLHPVFNNPYAIDIFQRKGLHNKLPLERDSLLQTNFDFLYVLFSKNPTIFQNNWESNMEYLISRDANSSLVLLQFCAKKISTFPNPWSLPDLLFNCSEYFFTCRSLAEYISTIFYLCQTHKEYSDARLNTAIDVFMQCLQSSDPRVLSVCYNALSFYRPKLSLFDIGLLSSHLQDEQLSPRILPLFLAAETLPAQQDLAEALLISAQTNETACLVLVKACDDEQFANLLSSNTWWVPEHLPTILDTLRIFISVMCHKSSRESLAAAHGTYKMFIDLVQEGDPKVMPFISSVVRRFPRKKGVLKRMSKSGCLKQIIESAIDMDDESATHAMLLMVKFLSDIGDCQEFALLPSLLRYQLKINGKSAMISLYLISRLCSYKLCAEKLGDSKLQKYFRKLLNDEDYKPYAQDYFANLEKFAK
ncbi:TKL family protein kinase [Trichomonas vaginalis G3]|uniref:TKL family protein kinase n=1 Tax=Trichomonas vaginalis (strain ATCC PRA-98 / G3) TaxID=412133 RepID=A2EVH8_TRIV3|nr:protein kinase protein [Trichomonas vaginalis G3]EAY03364.1 TKL family protein kinase [Trichomonas vaginalis G3]KAI5518839.1 protein kinase protein [Trichomonas vaginalis G3]|eukprot:XP_001315587.1 TKL family protein kinase [Trichomonas vaginalis G3]